MEAPDRPIPPPVGPSPSAPADPFATGTRPQPVAANPIDNPPPSAPPPAMPTHRVGGTPSASAKGLGGLTTALRTLFIIAVVVSAGAAVLVLSASSDAGRLADGDKLSYATRFDLADSIANNSAIASGVVVLLSLPIFVLLVIWTYRAHRNLEAFGATNPRLPSGMAIGSWFIPLFFFLGPYWCISDAYRGAAPTSGRLGDLRSQAGSKVVLAWWFTFCIGHTLSWLNGSNGDLAIVLDAPEVVATTSAISGVGYSILTVSAALGAVAVGTVGRRQDERRHAISATG